ncbi:hypothetical protein [Lentibacillus juripiscarius]|uniref:Uncharacterized protein n=1 Tax=Lentibacillus juripiscarius TaxID=257446 RepID=A0ABW5V389_9BACI
MDAYPYQHAEGSLLYQEETYHFRFKGVRAATIALYNVPGEQYYFTCTIEPSNQHWVYLPEILRSFTSAGHNQLAEAGVTWPHAFFETREQALQTAIDIIEQLLTRYQSSW